MLTKTFNALVAKKKKELRQDLNKEKFIELLFVSLFPNLIRPHPYGKKKSSSQIL